MLILRSITYLGSLPCFTNSPPPLSLPLGPSVSPTGRITIAMDRKSTTAKSVSGSHGINNPQSALPDLATYQAQWAKIHDDTVRQINEAREQEKKSHIANRSKSKPSPSS
ncbi:hypothetical protein BO71DRAFT_56705 [Aspergillus ellipticus CBS 707.79]|uniref:Uncharacterized protein n=1 Tax=Aspergillus ellipticus CBS 707.79 TaxID=1448320 RepID=A0A319D202_9EURO|nr:hypothetical protein BO71DRAFT_56705 [Aspergillus ellipticus CBS 707.79]